MLGSLLLRREPELYNVEEVFGRDARSVFPTQASKAEEAGAALDKEKVAEMLGARKFVTETEVRTLQQSACHDTGAVSKQVFLACRYNTCLRVRVFGMCWCAHLSPCMCTHVCIGCVQLNEIRAARGETTESSEPLKPLVEVLREAKEAKEQAFADKWKQMKTGE